MPESEVLVEHALARKDEVTATRALATGALVDAGTPRLRLDLPLDDAETKLVDDELAAGAGIVEATGLIAERRGVKLEFRTLIDEIVEQPEPEAELAHRAPSELAALPLALAVRERRDALNTKIESEFESFDDHVQVAFGSMAALNEVKTAVESYGFIRARLWEAGRRNASTIFREIRAPDQGAKLLGRPIQHGAHRLLVERLDGLTEPQGSAFSITDVKGFQPRRIAGKDSLSNHVLGLAIDIDAVWNPHVKSRGAIEIVLRHTRVNFGEPIFEAGASVEKVYATLQDASNRLRDWLRVALPTYKRLGAAVADATAKKQAAELAVRKARTESEKRAAARTLEQSEADLRNAQAQLSESMDAFEVGELAKEWGLKVLEEWETRGLFTVPLELARRLKERGFDWGAEWDTHKDVMHFELDPDKFLPPERRDRPVD